MVGGVPVAGRHPGPVDIERRGGASVAQPVRDRAQVYSAGQQLGGHEVAEIMETHVRQSDAGTQPSPTLGDHLGSPWESTVPIAGEDQRGLLEATPGLHGALNGGGPAFGKGLGRLSGERHHSGTAGLGRLDHHPGTRRRADGALDPDDPLGEVDVAPAQRGRFRLVGPPWRRQPAASSTTQGQPGEPPRVQPGPRRYWAGRSPPWEPMAVSRTRRGCGPANPSARLGRQLGGVPRGRSGSSTARVPRQPSGRTAGHNREP